MKNFLAQFKVSKKQLVILLVIVACGILLRVYHHGQWLRFNADQSRDALLVSNYLDGKSSLPLLGPKAGGTEFKLGPMFYYLQIMSAAIFGNSPENMALPDLVAGILTIPLLFLFLRRYFKDRVALILTLVGSFSIFLVKYARFAWNPNSGPFYTLLLLLAMLEIAQKGEKKQNWWLIAAGLSMGIGVQLHTLLMVIMPITVLAFAWLLARRNVLIWKKVAVIFAIAIFLNAGQIYSELESGGANIGAFFSGATSKTSRGKSLISDFAQDVTCQVQSNAFIVSGLGSNDECGVSVLTSTYKKAKGAEKILVLGGFVLSLAFTLFGVWKWIMALKAEKNEGKKDFLVLTGIYALVAFLLLIPLAKDLSLRFYLAIAFVPFVLLGFLLDKVFEYQKMPIKMRQALPIVIAGVLVFTNFTQIKAQFDDYANKKQISGSTKSEITLGETRFLADYIMAHAQAKSTVLIEGKQKYLFKYLKSIEYFTRKDEIKLETLSKKNNTNVSNVLISVGNAKNKGKLATKLAETYASRDVKLYGRFSAVQLMKK